MIFFPRLSLPVIMILFLSGCQETQQVPQTAYLAQNIKKTVVKIPATGNDTVCIAATGDIMLGTSYPDSRTLPPDSAKQSFKSAAAALRSADVTFGNLEGVLLDTGAPAPFKLHQLSKPWLFRMPVRDGGILKAAGFNLLSLANNHLADFGNHGRLNTMHALDSLGINYGGQTSHPAAVFKIKNTTFGFCAFAPNSQTLSIFDLKAAARLIRKLKQRCDIVIVSFHGGGEGVAYEHVPCVNEIFNREKRGDVHAFAHNAIDAGADMILGNGPHVCRALELYKHRLIAYSLGNFCTYRCVSVEGVCGFAPLLKLYTDKKGRFLKGRITGFRQTHNHGLVSDALNRPAMRIRALTNSDFEQPGLTIDDNGGILPKGRE